MLSPLFVDASSATMLQIIDIPDEVTIMEPGHGGEPVAWHTFSPDRADEFADQVKAAAARARQ